MPRIVLVRSLLQICSELLTPQSWSVSAANRASSSGDSMVGVSWSVKPTARPKIKHAYQHEG